MGSTRKNGSVRSTWRAKQSKTHASFKWNLAVAAEKPNRFYSHRQPPCTPFLLYRTLLLKVVATKAATTTMETTTLTVAETVVMLNVWFPVDQCKRDKVSNYELREGKGPREYNKEEPRELRMAL
jgi:hypothetical protein